MNCKLMRKFMALFLVFSMMFAMMPAMVWADSSADRSAKLVEEGLKDATNYWTSKQAADFASFDNEWYFFDLSRAGVSIDPAVIEKYVANVTETYAGRLTFKYTKPTTLARVTLALGAVGADPTKVGKINLVEMLYNNKDIGGDNTSNEAMWALIALDSKNYAIPTGAAWTRDKLIDATLEYQNSDKGFVLFKGGKTDIDMTAMAIQALAPYYNKNAKVKKAVDGALEFLKSNLNKNCQFERKEQGGTSVISSETSSQVLIALAAMGMDPLDANNGFVKGDKNLLTGLDAFRVKGKGFKHVASVSVNAMATEQAMRGLESCRRLSAGEKSLYDLSDAGNQPGDDTSVDNAKKAKQIVSKMSLTTVATKTKKKTVTVKVNMTNKTAADLKSIQKLGYNVKYSFYSAAKQNGAYKVAATKKANSYIFAKGKKGARFYYKTQVRVYDKKGKLIAQTSLAKSKSASQAWRK